MISIAELCKYPLESLPLEHQWNLQRLHFVLNFIRRLYDLPMIVTSGYRTEDDQKKIYSGASYVPLSSCHLIGAAADIEDKDGSLKAWLLARPELCGSLQIYFENFDATSGWVHIQIFPPKSGSRFFKP